MATTWLPQAYVNTEELLSFFVVDEDGFLVDPDSIECAIFDPDGAQVFPIAGWEDQSSIGRFDRGHFFAVDPDTLVGWQVPADAAEGTWLIRWRWREDATSALRTWPMAFDVVASRDEGAGTGFVGLPYRALVSPITLRNHGLSLADATDSRLEALIVEAQAYVEFSCQQAFRPVASTLRLQGGASDRLFLGTAIVAVDWLKANSSTTEVTRSTLAVAFAPIDRTSASCFRPDPRRQPTISIAARESVFGVGLRRGGRFEAGRLNQKLKGVFGFLEADGKVPALIERAATLLVYATAVAFVVGDNPGVAGPISSKTIDSFSISYADAGTSGAATASRALARSREVEEILTGYRAPIGLGSPDPLTRGVA